MATPLDDEFITPEIIEKDFKENTSLNSLVLAQPYNMIYEYLVGIYLNQYIDYDSPNVSHDLRLISGYLALIYTFDKTKDYFRYFKQG